MNEKVFLSTPTMNKTVYNKTNLKYEIPKGTLKSKFFKWLKNKLFSVGVLKYDIEEVSNYTWEYRGTHRKLLTDGIISQLSDYLVDVFESGANPTDFMFVMGYDDFDNIVKDEYFSSFYMAAMNPRGMSVEAGPFIYHRQTIRGIDVMVTPYMKGMALIPKAIFYKDKEK